MRNKINNIKRKNLYFQAFDIIKEYITSNNLMPGDMLPTEMELSESMGVSRNVIREAIKTLEIIGIVTSTPGVGRVINSYDASFIANCMFVNLIKSESDIITQTDEVRKVLELGFARSCFNTITPQQIEDLQNCVKEMESIDEHSKKQFDIDAKFHRILFKNIKNDVLMAFIESTWSYKKVYDKSYIGTPPPSIFAHQSIINALREKSYPKFKNSLRYHFSQKKLNKDREYIISHTQDV